MGVCAARRTRRARQGLTFRRCACPAFSTRWSRAAEAARTPRRRRSDRGGDLVSVSGVAEALFSPADEDDLAYVLSALPGEIPVTTIGLGSNLIVRDGGVGGLVIRLGGRAFGAIEVMDGSRLVAGAATPDQYVAKAAAKAGRRRLGVPARRARLDRRGVGHERRRARRRGQRRAHRSARARPDGRETGVFECRNGFFLPPQLSAGRRRLHQRDVSGPPGRAQGDRSRDGAHHPRARSLAANSRNRRLDLEFRA